MIERKKERTKMSDKTNDRIYDENGNTFMTEEEAASVFKGLGPTAFDPTSVKNSELDIQYGKLPEHLLDLYLPEAGSKPYPVMFYVHGGGWTMGSKTMAFLNGVIGLIEHGYAVISVDYRLAPQTTFPEFLFDVKTAVRWARANADKYGFDASRFAMAGDSAGGHITLMMGFTADRPEYAGYEYGWQGYSDGLQAICDMYGPSILDVPLETFFRESGIPRLQRPVKGRPDAFEAAFGTTNANLRKLISPISHVHKDIPPVLMLQGVKDGVVPYQHSTLLHEKIKEVCGDNRSELILFEDRNHADGNFNTKANSDTIAAFLSRFL